MNNQEEENIAKETEIQISILRAESLDQNTTATTGTPILIMLLHPILLSLSELNKFTPILSDGWWTPSRGMQEINTWNWNIQVRQKESDDIKKRSIKALHVRIICRLHCMLQIDIYWCMTIQGGSFPLKPNNDIISRYTFLCNTLLIHQYTYDSSATHAQIQNNPNAFAAAQNQTKHNQDCWAKINK